MADAADQLAARLVAGGAALVATSVLVDSAMEHYRGSFRNPAMWLPLVASGLEVAFGGDRVAAPQGDRLPMVRALGRLNSVGVGATGLGFHAFNVKKRPGGVTLQNLFHGAPVGAPAALILAGALGAAADALARPQAAIGPLRLGSGRAIAALCAVGIAGTVGEAWLLHFRGAFQHRAMYVPVTVPPVAAVSLALDAIAGEAPRPFTAVLLAATAAIGVAGVGFHANGIARRMGGWRNWRQNMLAGPPLPAPPAFTGLAIAGLGALLLMRRTANG